MRPTRAHICYWMVLLLPWLTVAAANRPFHIPPSTILGRRVSSNGAASLPSSVSTIWGLRSGSTTSHSSSSVVQQFCSTILEARRHLASAAVARAVSITTMFPMDAIKTRVQMKQANPLRLKGIFNGVGTSLSGQVPYGTMVFGSYEVYKRNLNERFPNVDPSVNVMFAAILGDLTGSILLTPSEVVKQKLQAGMFASTIECVKNIWNTHGWRGFYEGYFGGISRDVPFRVSQLVTYEATKSFYLKLKAKRQFKATNKKRDAPVELSALEAAACGAVAGTISSALTCPLDRFKTLLMTDSSKYGGSVASAAAKVWQEEGLRGFSRGMVPRIVYIAPSVAIFFVAYEVAQQKFKKWL